MLFVTPTTSEISHTTPKLWHELRDLRPGDVFSFCIDGETFMLIARKGEGIYRVCDHDFYQHDVLGGMTVYVKEKTDADYAKEIAQLLG